MWLYRRPRLAEPFGRRYYAMLSISLLPERLGTNATSLTYVVQNESRKTMSKLMPAPITVSDIPAALIHSQITQTPLADPTTTTTTTTTLSTTTTTTTATTTTPTTTTTTTTTTTAGATTTTTTTTAPTTTTSALTTTVLVNTAVEANGAGLRAVLLEHGIPLPIEIWQPLLDQWCSVKDPLVELETDYGWSKLEFYLQDSEYEEPVYPYAWEMYTNFWCLDFFETSSTTTGATTTTTLATTTTTTMTPTTTTATTTTTTTTTTTLATTTMTPTTTTTASQTITQTPLADPTTTTTTTTTLSTTTTTTTATTTTPTTTTTTTITTTAGGPLQPQRLLLQRLRHPP
eukprot:GHVT01018779.1.p1 GENE.GHVT01018779.1~~GHVT01018779.1.p1  ORF type:complete len:345 (-),score=20.43 GHVT01018779.1:56-1090(-)